MSEDPEAMAQFEASTLLAEIFAASPDAVVVIDPSWRIVLASPAVAALFGYSPDELVGQPLELLIPESRRDVHRDHLRHYFDQPHPRVMGAGLELSGRRVDGTELAIDVSLAPVRLGTDLLVAGFVRDATERRRGLDRLRAVNDITQRLLAGAQMGEILPLIARSARLLCSCDAAWIVMPGPTQLEIVAVDGPHTEVLLGVGLSAVSSRSAEVMYSGTPDVIGDLSTADNVPSAVVDLDLGPGLYVPFAASERRLGTLVLARRHGLESFQPLDVAFAQAFAGAAATATELGSARSEIDRLNIIAEDERIARDLHDSVIQELFALGMSLQATGSSVTGAAGDRISAVVEGLDDVIRQIRNTIFRLPGRSEVASSLREEMLRLADTFRHEQGVLPRIAFEGPVDFAVPEFVRDHLLHVFAEGLSNIARHAKASKIDVVVSVQDEQLTLSLMDDGVGVGSGPSAGNGIRNMITRAENLGGTCSVAPRAPGGTLVEWTVPLNG